MRIAIDGQYGVNGSCQMKMGPYDYVGMVFEELRRAERKFPGFPTDPVHAAAILAEEVGELQQACLKWTYEGGNLEDVKKEAVQSAAMALRFLFNIESLRCRPSEQEKREEHES